MAVRILSAREEARIPGRQARLAMAVLRLAAPIPTPAPRPVLVSTATALQGAKAETRVMAAGTDRRTKEAMKMTRTMKWSTWTRSIALYCEQVPFQKCRRAAIHVAVRLFVDDLVRQVCRGALATSGQDQDAWLLRRPCMDTMITMEAMTKRWTS